MSAQPDLELLPASAAHDDTLAAQIAQLANDVYADAERGMWQPGVPRTTPEDVARAIGAGEIMIARLDDRVVGVVRTRVADGVGWRGMLAVHDDVRGTGVGRMLVDATEQMARDAGAEAMQVEILSPADDGNAYKREHARRSQRLGYRHVRDTDLRELDAELATLLAVPCVLRVYRRDLTDAAR
jgi:GNAT superfamily N-acetyltransferase